MYNLKFVQGLRDVGHAVCLTQEHRRIDINIRFPDPRFALVVLNINVIPVVETPVNVYGVAVLRLTL
jgi:hypothetical protein